MFTHNQSHHRLTDTAVYNSRNLTMFQTSRLRWLCCVLLLCSTSAFAADWRVPETQMAEKISAITGPGVIALEVSNRSSISSSDVDQIRRGITSALAVSGIRVWNPDQASATAKVTLSENLQSYVWVVEVKQGANETNTAIVSVPRPDSALAAQNAPPLAIRATPIVSRSEPILDFALLDGSPRRALLLGEDSVALYEENNGHWIAGQSIPINHPHPFPRDARGRIILRRDHLFDAYLPGIICHSTNGLPLAATCSQSDDPWPLGTDTGLSAFFAPARNFFTGALVPGIGKQRSAPAFYSAVAISKPNYVLWIFSGTDNQIHFLDGINQQAAPRIHWGSSIAGAHAACRPDAQVLATSVDAADEDSVQAFEFPDREPVAVTQKLAINGVVTALWSATAPDSANLVYRNAGIGNYEAVQLNLACGQ